MPPKVATTTSPTQTLWAQQLRREHGFLLGRVKGLEAEVKRVDASVRAASSAATEQIESLRKKFQSLIEKEGGKAIEALEKKVSEGFEKVEAEIESITLTVKYLDDHGTKAAAEQAKSTKDVETLARRVEEMEHSLQEYERTLGQLGNKVDEETIEVIRAQLTRITEQVRKDGVDITTINESLTVLDAATEELKRRNETLAEELKEVAERPVPEAAPIAAPSVEEAIVAPSRPTRETQVIEPRATRRPPPAKGKGKGKGKTVARSDPTDSETLNFSQRDSRGLQSVLNSDSAARPIIPFGRGYARTAGTPEVPEENSQDVEPVDSPVQDRRPPPRKCKPTQSIEPAETQAPQRRGRGRPPKAITRAHPPNGQVEEAETQLPQGRTGPAQARKSATQTKPQTRRQKAKPVKSETVNTRPRTRAAAANALVSDGDHVQTSEPETLPPRAAKRKAEEVLQSQAPPPRRAAKRKAEEALQSQAPPARKVRAKKEPVRKTQVKKETAAAPIRATKKRKVAVKKEARVSSPDVLAPTENSRIPTDTAAANLFQATQGTRRGLTNIYSASPVSSPPARVEQEDALPQGVESDNVEEDHAKPLMPFDSDDSENMRAMGYEPILGR